MMSTYGTIGFGHIPRYHDDGAIIPARVIEEARPTHDPVEDMIEARMRLMSKATRHLHVRYVKGAVRVLMRGSFYVLLCTWALSRSEPLKLAGMDLAVCELTGCERLDGAGPRPIAFDYSRRDAHAARQGVVQAVDHEELSGRPSSIHPSLIVDASAFGSDSVPGLSQSRALDFWRGDGKDRFGIKVQFISSDRSAWTVDRPAPKVPPNALPAADDSGIQGSILSSPSVGLSPAERRKADNRLRAELEGSKGTIYAPAVNPFLRQN